MDPSSLHHVDRDTRAARLSSVSIDFENYISDAYKALSDQQTLRVLRGLRHGVALAGIESSLRAAEWTTAVSPESGVPFQSRIWTLKEMSGGTATLDPAPYRIIGARTVAGTNFPLGQNVSMKEVLIENTRWLDVSYDASTGEIVAQGEDSGYDGRIWIPERRLENPAVPRNYAQGHRLRRSDHDGGYPPPHLFHLTRLVESVREEGVRPGHMFRAAQAAFGAPFAYAGGTILGYKQGDNWAWATIEMDDGTKTASFLPRDATGGEAALKPAGTEVRQFEPLVTGGSPPTETTGTDRTHGTPMLVAGTTGSTNTVHLDGSDLTNNNPGLSAGDRARIRVLSQDVDSFLVVESTSGLDITMRGEIPPIAADDWAYLSKRTSAASGPGEVSLSVSTPWASGNRPTVTALLDRMVPPPMSYNLNGATDSLSSPGYITLR
jgi:hypothetical protein